MDIHRLAFAQLLKDGLQVLTRLQLIVSCCLFNFELVRLKSELCVRVNKLAFIVLVKLLQCPSTVASALGCWVGRDSHNPNAVKLSKLVILKLLADCPGDQVAARSEASLHLLFDVCLADFAFKSNLDSAENVRQLAILSGVFERPKEHKDLMRRRVRKHLQIVRRIFVMTRNKNGHEL